MNFVMNIGTGINVDPCHLYPVNFEALAHRKLVLNKSFSKIPFLLPTLMLSILNSVLGLRKCEIKYCESRGNSISWPSHVGLGHSLWCRMGKKTA